MTKRNYDPLHPKPYELLTFYLSNCCTILPYLKVFEYIDKSAFCANINKFIGSNPGGSMSEIAKLMDPKNQVSTHRRHSQVYCKVLGQEELREGLWEVEIEIGLVKGSMKTKVYFDKPIEHQGSRENFTIWIRHADECEFTYEDENKLKQVAFYFFILDVVVMESGLKQNFQADHYAVTA
jgi:hypothetical protein